MGLAKMLPQLDTVTKDKGFREAGTILIISDLRLRHKTVSTSLTRPSRSAVKLLAETTCGCRQARPVPALRRRQARARTHPQKFPSSPARHFAPGRGASQEARRPLAGSLSAGSPLLPLSSSRLLPLHGCRTEPLNSHRSPPPPACRAGGAPAPAGAPGRADRQPPSNSPETAFRRRQCGATLPEPRDPLTRLGSRGAGETVTLAAGAQARRAKTLTSARRQPRAPPALGAGPRSSRPPPPPPPPPPPRSDRACAPELRGPRAVRVSWRGCAGGCGAERRRRRARGQLLPPRAAPPPSSRPASRAAAVSPAPRARRPRGPRHRLGGRTGLKGPDVYGFKGTAPAEARGQAAAVSPVSRRPLRPGRTRRHPEHKLPTAGQRNPCPPWRESPRMTAGSPRGSATRRGKFAVFRCPLGLSIPELRGASRTGKKANAFLRVPVLAID
ncbi:formin-like protein 5 [Mustela erminea]|uniref:formin-like protein 5 n=1 Tax=Mustela erminea TaxID=36723 RepID=UPI0013873313|nr:formin-like protein 5 [Mustela erminea]